MELLRGRPGGRTLRWQVLLLLLLFFDAVAVLRFSAAAGENPVIFEYGEMPYVPGNYTLQVPGVANVGQIDVISCTGYFIPDNNTLGLEIGTDFTSTGSCLYGKPVQLTKSTSVNPSTITSFSTMFQLRVSTVTNATRMSFIITNDTTTQQTDRYFAVNFQFSEGAQFPYPIQAHVGVQVNNTSLTITPLMGNLSFEGGGVSLDVWIESGIEYDQPFVRVYASGSSPNFDKPTMPIIISVVNLTTALSQQPMYVGFSGSSPNMSILQASANLSYSAVYVSGWTFNSDGPAPDFPRDWYGKVGYPAAEAARAKKRQDIIITVATVPSVLILLLLVVVIFMLYKRNARLTELAKKYEIDEALLDQGPRSFKYKVLSAATKGFSSNALLGSGGFGSVYRGRLWLKGADKPTEIAVKRISSTSHQGAREFLAEVKIIGQVQHRNLVRLLGWCHEKGELLLVYDYMPNGSVDQHLFKDTDGSGEVVLTWSRRLKIVTGIASALAYLHEEWEQRVIHRDIKSSNIMLDIDFNGRLGDFGLARLSAHDQAPPSTAVLAGTYGYLAPEMAHTLKATEKTDVYSFGAMVLEIATGKRPILSYQDQQASNYVLLVDWVWCLYRNDNLLEAADWRLREAFDPGEMIMFLKIGLLCSHPDPIERPNMREVVSIWKGCTPFPPLPRTKPVPSFIPCIDVYDTQSTLHTDEYGHPDEFSDQEALISSMKSHFITPSKDHDNYVPPPHCRKTASMPPLRSSPSTSLIV